MTDPFRPAAVQRLADAQPTRGANPAGDTARAGLVHRVKRATPGRYSSLFGTGRPFHEVFFPATADSPDDARIGEVTGLNHDFFAAFAVLCLCGQMVSATNRLRPQLLTGDIGAGLAAHNRTLRERAWAWYAHTLTVTDGPVRTVMASFGTEPARREGRAHYIAGLTSPTWINLKLSQRDLGQWPEREWELYHHWVKLAALGAPADEIDRTIAAIRAGGLEIPPEVGPGDWRVWDRWSTGDIGGSDVGDAAGPIVATTYIPGFGGRPAQMPEGNSFEFTANSQPGNRYRRPPPSSCFAAGTRVVLAGGELRAIEHVRPGDRVHTPHGPRTVLFRATPAREDRPLARFTGPAGGFAFAPSHPFVVHPTPSGSGGAAYAAADPLALAETVPALAQFGIEPLNGPDPVVLSRYTPGGDEPFPAPALRPDPPGGPTHLYDLFVEVGPDGRSEFYAGDDAVQLKVSSEAPRFGAAPRTTEVVIGVLEAITPTVLATLADVPDHEFADVLTIGLHACARELLADIGPAVAASPRTRLPRPEPTAQAAAVCAFARSAAARDEDTQRRIGALIERFVATFARSFEAAVALGWRVFPPPSGEFGTVLAVTVYDLELVARPGYVRADAARVRLELRRGHSGVQLQLPVRPAATADRSCYTVDDVAYFDQWRPIGEDPAQAQREPVWRLRLGIDGDPAEAVIPLPYRIDPAFVPLGASLIDPDGTAVGRVALDLRALRVTDLVTDLGNRAAWNPADEPAVARALTEHAAAHLNARFPVLAHRLRPLAARSMVPAG